MAAVPFPVNTESDVKVDAPVPPFETDKLVPDQSSLLIANVPPNVKFPLVVTVPVKVKPFTVPVPPTLVTAFKLVLLVI